MKRKICNEFYHSKNKKRPQCQTIDITDAFSSLSRPVNLTTRQSNQLIYPFFEVPTLIHHHINPYSASDIHTILDFMIFIFLTLFNNCHNTLTRGRFPTGIHQFGISIATIKNFLQISYGSFLLRKYIYNPLRYR